MSKAVKAKVNKTSARPDAEVYGILGTWTRTGLEGECSVCNDGDHMAKLEFNHQTLRLCLDCADSFWAVLSSMLEDAPE